VRVQRVFREVKTESRPNIHELHTKEPFPPPLQADSEKFCVIRSFINDTLPSEYHESGCAVCGRHQLIKDLEPLEGCLYDLSILEQTGMGVTRLPRSSVSDAVTEIPGPVIDEKCKYICKQCASPMSKKNSSTLIFG